MKSSICTVANGITAVRIVGSCVLLTLIPLSIQYFLVYALCGMSDAIDGWLARRMGTESSFGSAFDSAADTVFVLAIAVSLLPVAGFIGWLWAWIGLVAVIKIAGLTIACVRFRVYGSVHSYANKVAGLAIFALPVLFFVVGSTVSLVVVCVIASFAALEELVLLATMPLLDRNERGLLGKLLHH